MFLSLYLRFTSNTVIALNPYRASVHHGFCNTLQTVFYVFWIDFYHMEPFLTEQLFEHQSFLLTGLCLHGSVYLYYKIFF